VSTALPNEPEQILEQSAWMRRIALALVHDAAMADDVVQTAWLRAVEHRTELHASPRGWLARVVRNLASKERRGERRREQREHAVARPEALPPTDDIAARIEVHRRLLDALSALGEPYRRTLTMRYLDELSGAEIAAREGVPEGTVRWRLAHALELLRGALDRRHGGDRRAWCLALLPSLRDSNVPLSIGAAAAVQGVLVMNVLAKVAVAAVAVIGVSAGVWWLRPDAQPAQPHAIAPASVAAAELAALPPPVETRAEVAPAARADESAHTAPAAEAAAPAADAARIRARIVDAAGRPLARARVASEHPSASAESDGDGELTLDLSTKSGARKAILTVSLARFATRWIEAEYAPGQTTSLGDLVLERGTSISGRVLAPDGKPQPDARVIAGEADIFGPDARAALRGPGTYPGAASATTDALGEFRIDGVAAGTFRVWASAAATRFSWSAPIVVQVGADVSDVELRLVAQSESDWLAGVVLDPSGAPVPKARLWIDFRSAGWTEGHAAQTDERGRFRELIVLDGPHDLRASDSQSRWPTAVALGVLPGARELTLQFREPEMLELDVHSADGKPVAKFTVNAQRAIGRESIGALKQTLLEPGRVTVPMPTEPFMLTVVAPGFAAADSGAIDPSHSPGRLDFELESRPGIGGLVRAHGAAVAGASVMLFALPEKGRCYQHNGFDVRVNPTVAHQTATDSDGRFLLTPSESGEFALVVQADGWATAERGPLVAGATQDSSELTIDLDRGGAIEGRVLVPESQRAEGVIVSINRGDTFARTVRVDQDGRFRFETLAAGDWQVRRADEMLDGLNHGIAVSLCDKRAFASDCSVAVGQLTRFDIDLRDARPCEVDGELSWGGRPARGWTVSLWPATGVSFSDTPSTALDELGHFTLATKQPGAYRLSFNPPDSSSELNCVIDLERGRKAWSASIDTATLIVRRASAEGLSVRGGDDAHSFYGQVKGPSEATLEVPAGEVDVGRFVLQPDASLSGWQSVFKLDLARGEKRTVDVP
jgi:RNA polymerase sigma-70 factor (ECF subfamily)